MSNFLPQNYEAPQGNSNYMKFEQGENKFRILTQPIVGWLDWKDKKPYRFTMDDKPAKPMTPGQSIKHFWAMVVWNYTEQAIQVLEITQTSIQRAISDYSNDADWGAPYDYDIKVTKSGAGLDTKYVIAPVPHKKVHPEILRLFKEKPVNLKALYSGDDPFEANDEVTPFGAQEEKVPVIQFDKPKAVTQSALAGAAPHIGDDDDLPF